MTLHILDYYYFMKLIINKSYSSCMKCHVFFFLTYCHICVRVYFICFIELLMNALFSAHFSSHLFSVRWSSTYLQGTCDPVWPPESHHHCPSDSHLGVHCYWKPQTYSVLEQTRLEALDFPLNSHVLCDLILLPLYSGISFQTLNSIAFNIELCTRFWP